MISKAACHFFSETPIAKTNNLKVTIGAAELVSRNEVQISKVKRMEICKPNYPIAEGFWKLSGERKRSGINDIAVTYMNVKGNFFV